MSDYLRLGQPCPGCRRAMFPLVLVCECGIKVEGPIHMNEFAALGPEHLQFLRIFILNEGRIRDMEAALGVSYPTIKARIKDLKAVLQLVGNEMTAGAPDKNAPIGKDDLSDIISKLEKGELTPEDAIRTLSRAPDD